MSRKLFGTDGIRGRANIYPMTGEVAFALGRAATSYFQKKTKSKKPIIIIGKDTRLSCYMLEQAFSAGVCAQGGRAILTGPIPTPGVAFVTQSMRADAGVMISASHNAYYDNGIKLFDRTGHKLADSVEIELERMVLNSELIPKKLDDQLGSAKRLDEAMGRYIVQVKNAFRSDYNLEGMRLIVDGANGAGYKVAPMAFSELGAEVIAMGNEPDGTNINKGVGALSPEACAEKVKLYRADLGICLDGDGDRIAIVDETGAVADGDKLIGVLAKFLKDTNELNGSNEIVGTVMSNFGLEKYLEKIGLELFRVKVGDRYITERMLASGACFGGEPSGHLIFKKYSTTGDGILAALKVIECVKYYKKSLSVLLKEVELFPQALKNVKVKNKRPFEEIPEVEKAVDAAIAKLKDTGRVLLRYSGTENLARVMVEGEDEELVVSCCDDLVNVVSESLAK
ncbi:MAG: phosphoglucosamine mutase [Bacteriovoracaceae bacterium]